MTDQTPHRTSQLLWRKNPAARAAVWGVVAIGVQTVAVLVGAGVGVVAALSGSASSVSETTATGAAAPLAPLATALGMAALAVALAAVLIVLGRGLALGRPWVRGPLLTVEVLAALCGSVLRDQLGWAVAAAVSIPALVVVVILFIPAVGVALTDPRRLRGAFPDGEPPGNTHA